MPPRAERYMSSRPMFSPNASNHCLPLRARRSNVDSTPSERSRNSSSLDASLVSLFDTPMPPRLIEPCVSHPPICTTGGACPTGATCASAGAETNRLETRTEINFLVMIFLPASSEQELSAPSRCIGAVDRVVAVVARPGDQARVDGGVECAGFAGAGRGRITGRAQPPATAAVGRAGVPRDVVAILAKVRDGFVEQLAMRRAVRIVAGQAVLLDRRVGKHVRTPFVGMTVVALVVHRFLLDHRVAERAMRVVAVGAPDLALENRVMRRLEKRRADVLMAFAAGIGLDLP